MNTCAHGGTWLRSSDRPWLTGPAAPAARNAAAPADRLGRADRPRPLNPRTDPAIRHLAPHGCACADHAARRRPDHQRPRQGLLRCRQPR